MRDISPIADLLKGLTNNLPESSIYLGFSLLQSPEAWAQDGQWNEELLRKIAEKNVVVCRLWAFNSDREFENLQAEMRRQTRAGVVVRYLSPDKTRRLIQHVHDLTLVMLPDVRSSVSASRDDVSSRLRDAFRSPDFHSMPGLRFDIRAGMFLEGVEILSDQETDRRFDDFLICWESAEAI